MSAPEHAETIFVMVEANTQTRVCFSPAWIDALIEAQKREGYEIRRVGYEDAEGTPGEYIFLHGKPKAPAPSFPAHSHVERGHFEDVLAFISRKLRSECEETKGDAIPKGIMANLRADVEEWLEQSREIRGKAGK